MKRKWRKLQRTTHRPVLIRQTETRFKIGLLIGLLIFFATPILLVFCADNLPVVKEHAGSVLFVGFAIGGFIAIVSAVIGFIRTG